MLPNAKKDGSCALLPAKGVARLCRDSAEREGRKGGPLFVAPSLPLLIYNGRPGQFRSTTRSTDFTCPSVRALYEPLFLHPFLAHTHTLSLSLFHAHTESKTHGPCFPFAAAAAACASSSSRWPRRRSVFFGVDDQKVGHETNTATLSRRRHASQRVEGGGS